MSDRISAAAMVDTEKKLGKEAAKWLFDPSNLRLTREFIVSKMEEERNCSDVNPVTTGREIRDRLVDVCIGNRASSRDVNTFLDRRGIRPATPEEIRILGSTSHCFPSGGPVATTYPNESIRNPNPPLFWFGCDWTVPCDFYGVKS